MHSESKLITGACDLVWSGQDFEFVGVVLRFFQDNHLRSSSSKIRGLNYQIQHPQGKLIGALAGRIYDAAIDLRRSSQALQSMPQ